jgi:uncharacterized protein (DUF433 family)
MIADEADLIERYIVEDPQWPGAAEARLAAYGVPVWALIGHFKAIGGDPARVAYDYDVPEVYIHAALAYYQRHQPEIDARLIENAAPAV